MSRYTYIKGKYPYRLKQEIKNKNECLVSILKLRIDIMEKELQRKIEEYNESLLKNAVISFNGEVIQKELKDIMRKKMSYSKYCMAHLSRMFDSIVNSNSTELKKRYLKKGETIDKLLDHVFKEITITDACINNVIHNLAKQQIKLENGNNHEFTGSKNPL